MHNSPKCRYQVGSRERGSPRGFPMRRGRQGPQGQGRGYMNSDERCWMCGQLGHISRSCPMNLRRISRTQWHHQQMAGPNAGYWRDPENPNEESQLPLITLKSDQEPILQIQLNDKHVPMMVDTRATYMCVGVNSVQHLPRSSKFAKTIGFLGPV